MPKKKSLLFIVGPTAIGKTSLAIYIAQLFNTEIISADSRQFYKEIPIGTAQPTAEELEKVPHHLVANLSVQEPWSAADFATRAKALIQEMDLEPFAVVVGGSGMYLNAIEYGFDPIPAVPERIRSTLNETFKNSGIAVFQDELKKVDPDYYQEVDLRNPQRLIRALEVFRATGKPFSSFRNKTKVGDPDYNILKIGLELDRAELYERINQRVDLMLEDGLLDEVRQCLPYKELNSLNTVGYKELFQYLEGQYTLEGAIDEIKKNTRRFAKRQMTWFKKQDQMHWFSPTQTNEIVKKIKEHFNLP